MGNVTNYKKHGYFYGLEDMSDETAFLIFCKRRSADIVKEFGSTLSYDEMVAKVYYQGMVDGIDLNKG